MHMIKIAEQLIKKFRININQIIANSDNTMDDIRSEAYLVVADNYSSIQENERVFINELKTRCLKFNKYGKRIESKERWEEFNKREEQLANILPIMSSMDDDKLCMLIDIKDEIGEENYKFLLDYFSISRKEMCTKYHISEPTVRKKAKDLLDRLREVFVDGR